MLAGQNPIAAPDPPVYEWWNTYRGSEDKFLEGLWLMVMSCDRIFVPQVLARTQELLCDGNVRVDQGQGGPKEERR